MRSALPVCVLVAATATLELGLPHPAAAQPDPQSKYIRVDFMKVVEGKQDDYPKLEEAWKAVHEDRVRKGQIESWSQYDVRLPPMSTSREYDAVTMTVFPSFAKVGEPYDEELKRRVAAFQQIESLTPDGIAGEETLVRLAAATPGGNGPSLRR